MYQSITKSSMDYVRPAMAAVPAISVEEALTLVEALLRKQYMDTLGRQDAVPARQKR